MESSLALTYDDLRQDIGFFLGWTRTITSWNTEQAAAIEQCLRSACRMFYFCIPIGGAQIAHQWSFLHPIANLTIPSGADSIDLPDDFGGLEGEVMFAGSNSVLGCSLPHTGIGRILSNRSAQPSMTGRPELVSINPKRVNSPTHGQRFELVLWPASDADYTVAVRYFVIPNALTPSRPYPYGGAVHAETLKAACLAAAEKFLDDSAGLHSENFGAQLAASISQDRRLKPQNLGYNGDNSDRLTGYERDAVFTGSVTYNGTQY